MRRIPHNVRKIPQRPMSFFDTRPAVEALKRHVDVVARTPRNLWHYESLQRAAAYIHGEFTRAGYQPRHQVYEVDGRQVANIEAERRARHRADSVLVIGAHYDSVANSPGANDNASGVAVMLELARLHAASAGAGSTVRCVAFVNEEPPYFMTEHMGSFRYAAEAAARGDHIVAMLSLETIGYYSDEVGSQRYPFPFSLMLPSRGNFLAMVSNIRSVRALVRVLLGVMTTSGAGHGSLRARRLGGVHHDSDQEHPLSYRFL